MKGNVEVSIDTTRAARLVLGLLAAVALGAYLVPLAGCGSDHSAGVSLGGSRPPTVTPAVALRAAETEPTPTPTPLGGA